MSLLSVEWLYMSGVYLPQSPAVRIAIVCSLAYSPTSSET